MLVLFLDISIFRGSSVLLETAVSLRSSSASSVSVGISSLRIEQLFPLFGLSATGIFRFIPTVLV